MGKPTDDPRFKDLEALWYQKLKEAGFNDIEYEKEPSHERFLKKSGTERRYETTDAFIILAKEEYYILVAEWIESTEFDEPIEKEILFLYAQGLTNKEIQTTLGISGHRYKVYAPIYKYLRRWGLKK